MFCSEGDLAGTDVWRQQQCSCSEVHTSFHALGPRKGEHLEEGRRKGASSHMSRMMGSVLQGRWLHAN